MFDDPDRFDPDRTNARDHLAFGGRSIHLWMGANLGRLEATIAIERLAAHYAWLALPDQQLAFHPNISLPRPATVAGDDGLTSAKQAISPHTGAAGPVRRN